MNRKGKKYSEQINQEYKQIPTKLKQPFTREEVYERLMRLGIEKRIYDLRDYEEEARIAITTLKENVIKIYNQLFGQKICQVKKQK